MRRLFLVVLGLLISLSVNAQNNNQSELQTHEALVKELYKMCSFEKEKLPDWDKMKNLFLPNSVILLKSGLNKFDNVDREGFIKLWLRDIEKYKLDKTGFSEKMKNMKCSAFGDIATYIIQYEASIPGVQMPPQPGLDMISLIKLDGRWWIASIVNDVPGRNSSIPESLFK